MSPCSAVTVVLLSVCAVICVALGFAFSCSLSLTASTCTEAAKHTNPCTQQSCKCVVADASFVRERHLSKHEIISKRATLPPSPAPKSFGRMSVSCAPIEILSGRYASGLYSSRRRTPWSLPWERVHIEMQIRPACSSKWVLARPPGGCPLDCDRHVLVVHHVYSFKSAVSQSDHMQSVSSPVVALVCCCRSSELHGFLFDLVIRCFSELFGLQVRLSRVPLQTSSPITSTLCIILSCVVTYSSRKHLTTPLASARRLASTGLCSTRGHTQ